MTQSTIAPRQTKYCTAIERILSELGHATNTELLTALRLEFPALSATTVHRASARLADRGQISIAPPAIDGSMRYDTNTSPHDHFVCLSCGMLRDADVKDEVIPILEAAIGDCRISGQLTISGICKLCLRRGKV